jgi:hypothetical protein
MLLVTCNRNETCEMKETCKHAVPHKPTKIFHTATLQKSWCHINRFMSNSRYQYLYNT